MGKDGEVDWLFIKAMKSKRLKRRVLGQSYPFEKMAGILTIKGKLTKALLEERAKEKERQERK